MRSIRDFGITFLFFAVSIYSPHLVSIINGVRMVTGIVSSAKDNPDSDVSTLLQNRSLFRLMIALEELQYYSTTAVSGMGIIVAGRVGFEFG